MFGQHNIRDIFATVSRLVHTDPLSINSLNEDAMTTTSPSDLQITTNFVQNAVSAH